VKSLDTKEARRKTYPGYQEQVHQKVVENTVDKVDDYSTSLKDGWNRK